MDNRASEATRRCCQRDLGYQMDSDDLSFFCGGGRGCHFTNGFMGSILCGYPYYFLGYQCTLIDICRQWMCLRLPCLRRAGGLKKRRLRWRKPMENNGQYVAFWAGLPLNTGIFLVHDIEENSSHDRISARKRWNMLSTFDSHMIPLHYLWFQPWIDRYWYTSEVWIGLNVTL